MKYEPHEYQKHAYNHIAENRKAGLFMEMGLGKSVVCLSHINTLIYQDLEVEKVLVIAPLRVAQSVWKQEAEKWDHTRHLRFSLILGTSNQRIEALKRKADVYVINRENIPWLVGFLGGAWPFKMVVVDESSSFKNSKSARFRALRMVIGKIDRMIILTGTPAGNGLIDLWSQIYLLDQGERLEKTVTGYRSRYFKPNKTNGHIVYSYQIRKDSEEMIFEKISDLVISMKNQDYLHLPDRVDNFVMVKFDAVLQKRYDVFEEEQVMKLYAEQENETDITAFNAGALSTKLLQFANGSVYDREGESHFIHDLKLNALEEIIESAGGKPVLVFYSFKSDLQGIQKRFGGIEFTSNEVVEKWNKGLVPLAIAHPASAGHGLNLQESANIIVWYGMTWSLELYMQANARLHRQGQKQTVYVYHIISESTLDLDVMEAVKNKKDGQDRLMSAIKARIEKYIIMSAD